MYLYSRYFKHKVFLEAELIKPSLFSVKLHHINKNQRLGIKVFPGGIIRKIKYNYFKAFLTSI